MVGIALMILSELFPPWKHTDSSASVDCRAGYYYYKNQPALKTKEEVLRCFPYHRNTPNFTLETFHVSTSINRLQLHAQRMLMFWLILGLLVAFHKTRSLLSWALIFAVSGVIIVGLTLLLLMLWN